MDHRPQQSRESAYSRSGGARLYFGKQCPCCGRRLRIPVDLLGREISCRHCGRRLEAAEGDANGRAELLLEKANQLLDFI